MVYNNLYSITKIELEKNDIINTLKIIDFQNNGFKKENKIKGIVEI